MWLIYDRDGIVVGTAKSKPSVCAGLGIRLWFGNEPQLFGPDDEIVPNDPWLTATWDDVRAVRNYLLQESDWTQLEDVKKIDKQAWIEYRILLRDIPTTFDSPQNVVWPESPSE